MVSTKHVKDRDVLPSDIVPAAFVLLNNFKKSLAGRVGIQSVSKIDPSSNIFFFPKNAILRRPSFSNIEFTVRKVFTGLLYVSFARLKKDLQNFGESF